MNYNLFAAHVAFDSLTMDYVIEMKPMVIENNSR